MVQRRQLRRRQRLEPRRRPQRHLQRHLECRVRQLVRLAVRLDAQPLDRVLHCRDLRLVQPRFCCSEEGLRHH
jgi:hypothetical protein